MVNFCYLLGDEISKTCALIDPAFETDRILAEADRLKYRVTHIINTHGHFDHVGANKKMSEVTGAPILIHALDVPMLGQLSTSAAALGMNADDSPAPERTIDEGDEISFGNHTLKVLHTPGHTPGGVSLHTDGHVFVGDTLFAGSIGRTDSPGGDFNILKASIQDTLFTLNDEVVVYTGHGPETTIGQERQHNPFVGQNANFG